MTIGEHRGVGLTPIVGPETTDPLVETGELHRSAGMMPVG